MPTAPIATRDAKVEAQVFWLKYQKEITALLVLAILAMVGFAGYRFYSDRKEAAAAGVLASAKSAQDYEQVIARYSGTPAGESAYLLLAEAQRKEKKFAEANATLDTFVNKYPKHELEAAARMAMATNLEAMGKIDDALLIYQKTAGDFPKSYIAPFALLAEVELLKAKGRSDEARRVCETIMTQYRESVAATEANRQLRLLKPSVSAQPGGRSTIAPGPTPPPMLARPPAAAPAPAKAPVAVPTPSAVPKAKP
jgi:predicted negative regulator of RcsB-dependent stress response